MKVIDIEKLERIVPNGGSGTGYGQYLKFRVHFEDRTHKDVTILDWYNSDQWPQFQEELNRTGTYIDNWNEIYNMFMTAFRYT